MVVSLVSSICWRTGLCLRIMSRFQKRTERNIMKFNKGRCKVPDLERISNLMHQHMLGLASWKAALQNLEVLVDHEPAMHLCKEGG